MKNYAGTLLVLLALVFSCTARATEVMVVSDTHYMAANLYADSELFIRSLRAGDGKYTQHSDELMAALCAEVERIMPDALIVTGDLTLNGERDSHIALANWFSRIEALGVPVWIIPGNHDINVKSARGFDTDGWYYTETVTPEQFAAIYADYMLPAEGGANLSYAVQVDDRLWIALTDVAYYSGEAQTFGLFTAGHAEWLESVLQRAGDVEVLTATHQNLLEHTAFSRDSFLMFGHETMASLAARYGVRLNLSGHMHAQNIVEQGGLTDAALGAFCNWPHRYALVTLEENGDMTYEASSLDAALLPEAFLEDSRTWFEEITREKTALAIADIAAEDRDAMAQYVTRFNLAYFSGTYSRDDASWTEDPGWQLWQAHQGNIFWKYLNLVMREASGDNLYRHWN